MGGARLTFEKLAIQMACGGGGSEFVNRAGGGATRPTDIVCDGCAIGSHPSAAVRLNDSVRSGARNSRVCRNQSGSGIVVVGGSTVTVDPVTTPNEILPFGDEGCT